MLITPPITKRPASPPLRVEHGVKLFHREFSCDAIGSRSIDWLLSLSSQDWTFIYVDPGCMDSAIGTCLRQILKDTLHVCARLPDEYLDVILTAGANEEPCATFAGQRMGLHSSDCPQAGLGYRVPNGIRSSVLHLPSHRAGGVTDWKGTVLISGWRYDGWAPQVRQDVSHIIKYSEKPKCCDKVPPFAHIVATELLLRCMGLGRPWSSTRTQLVPIGVLEIFCLVNWWAYLCGYWKTNRC